MSTDIKLSKAQLTEIIQSSEFLSNIIGKLGKETLMKLAGPLAKDVLPHLATKATSSVIDNFEKKNASEGAVGTGKGFTLLI